MNKLKRSLSAIMTAVLISVLLAGCGSSSDNIETRMRKVTGAEYSSSLDNVANDLADVQLTRENVESALKANGYGELKDGRFKKTHTPKEDQWIITPMF